MSAAVSILIALLSNEKLVNLIAGLLGRLVEKPDNDIDEEYAAAHERSLKIRMALQKQRLGGNIFLPDAELNKLKNARQRLDPAKFHGQI